MRSLVAGCSIADEFKLVGFISQTGQVGDGAGICGSSVGGKEAELEVAAVVLQGVRVAVHGEGASVDVSLADRNLCGSSSRCCGSR